ncbi:MAG: DUF4080 domain-containing protein [Erysipelotrichaceae bacterium]|nr:DUF4080 domain-containing protein [Erysipelotrichaceae bacterium]
MKTLLIGINSKYIHPNLAIRLLKANCSFPVDIKEFNIKHSLEDIYNYIIENKYEIVGISCYIWNIELVKLLLPLLRKHNIIIILGGPEVSYNSTYYLYNNLVDYVIKNEGEETFDLLIRYLHNDKIKIEDIPNLYYQDKFTFDKLVDISKSKMAYDLLEDVENQIIYIETSRGCPFHCGYCMASLDNKLRFFSIEEIKRQVLSLIEKGGRIFKFLDRTFNANKKNFISLIDFIIKHHKENNSFQFEITGDLLDDDVINYINEHSPKDLFRFEIGIQSTNLKANKAVYRIQNNEKLFHNIKLIQEKGIIDLHLDLIAGLPYEDYSSFINTFNEVLQLRPKELQLGFLKLLKGTKLYEEKDQYGYKFNKKAPYDIISNNFLSEEDVYNIHIVEDAFDYYYNKDYFKTSINYILDKTDNCFSFFHHLGKKELKSKKLEHTFKLLDDFVKENFIEYYNNFHELLILDYLNCYNIKPGSWWNERLSPKDKNEVIRTYHKNELKDIDINILYKYSLVIPLENNYLIAIYKDNKKSIYKIKRS